MTSKISSAKLLRETIKRNGAFAIFLLIGFFCYYPVGGMLFLRNSWFDSARADQFISDLQIFGIANPFLFCVTFSAALLLGIMQFSYLHSAEKADFYHSIPMRREKIFCIRYAAGFLVWLVPFAVNLLLFILVCAMRGIAVTEGTAAGVTLLALLTKGLLAHIPCFLLVYSLTVLAMLVTGKIFAAICAVAVFCGYVPAIKLLHEVLMEFYFTTFYALPDLGKSLAIQCTPVYAYIRICADTMTQVFSADLLIAITLISALICLLCLYFYRRRGSEMAGRTMAFRGIARVVKFLLVVPITLICTVFFYAVTDCNLLWEIFGWIFSLLLISGAIEFLYCMDIREVFRDKKQIALAGAVTLAVLAVFQLDLLGYDRWKPEKTEVESVNIKSSYAMHPTYARAYQQLVAKDGTVVFSQINTVDYEDDISPGYETNDLDAVFDLVEHSEAFSSSPVSETDDYWNYYWCRLVVTWHLKDGTQKVRSYEYTGENLVKWLAPIWEKEDYRKQTSPFLSVDARDVLTVLVAPAGSYFPTSVTLENGNTMPESKDAASENGNAMPESKDAAPESGNAVPESKDAAPENGNAMPESKDAAPENGNAVPESKDTASENGNAVPEGGDAVPESGDELEQEEAEDEIKYAEEAMADADLVSPQKPLTGAQLQKLAETFQQDLRDVTLAETLAGSEWDIQIIYRNEDGSIYGETFNLNAGFVDTIELLKEYGYELEDAV